MHIKGSVLLWGLLSLTAQYFYLQCSVSFSKSRLFLRNRLSVWIWFSVKLFLEFTVLHPWHNQLSPSDVLLHLPFAIYCSKSFPLTLNLCSFQQYVNLISFYLMLDEHPISAPLLLFLNFQVTNLHHTIPSLSFI